MFRTSKAHLKHLKQASALTPALCKFRSNQVIKTRCSQHHLIKRISCQLMKQDTATLLLTLQQVTLTLQTRLKQLNLTILRLRLCVRRLRHLRTLLTSSLVSNSSTNRDLDWQHGIWSILATVTRSISGQILRSGTQLSSTTTRITRSWRTKDSPS